MNPIIQFLQQYGPVFAVLAALATILSLVFAVYKASHERHVRFLKSQIAKLKQDLNALGGEDAKSLQLVNEQLVQQRDDAQAALSGLQGRYTALEREFQGKEQSLREQCERARQANEALTQELETAREELARRDQEDQTRANLLKKAMNLEGRVWERKALHGVPRFRPLHERHVAVVSVLNLKGGVGKTTITAHLGAALAARGYRPLLVDLDLQGSLSSLFILESVLADLRKEKRLLQHLLTGAAERRKTNLVEYCQPVLDGKSAVVPTTDSMAYAELNLTMRWLLRLGKKDTRFLLRRALHQKRVTTRYDIVLLDCPPLFNTCCVNALAASDYVLIPVTPSNKAAERVPLLLDRLKGLCGVINPDLQVAGIVLNRTRGVQLTTWEQDLWHTLLDRAKDQWKLPVHGFQTFIRQTTEVRDSENEFSPPVSGSDLHTAFSHLAAELEERLPRDCCRTTAAPLGPG